MTAQVWLRIAGVLIVVMALFGAGWYFSGLRGAAALAKAREQYSDAIARQAQAATAALAKRDADEAAFRAHNREVINGLQGSLADAANGAVELATRLRDAITSADRARTLSQSADRRAALSAAELAASQKRTAEVTRAVAQYDSACQQDAIRYAKLIEELKPQL